MTAAPSPLTAPDLSVGRKRLVLAATVLGSAMAFIDGSVVNVALPALQKALNAGPDAVQWVMNAYMLLLGALVLIGGAAADRFGRRAVFLAGLAIFTAASVACGLSPNVQVLIAGRAAQGIGAALLTPASLAILGSSFPEAERGRAIGAWAGFGALTTAAGPVLGGWLVDAVSWRAIFFINLPLAALAALLAVQAVPESRMPEAKGLDLVGAVLAAAGLGAATWALTEAGGRGLAHPAILAALAAGIVLLAAFVWHEHGAADAMAPPALFRSVPFTAANLLTLLLYFALGGALFFLPFELIRVRGWSATAAGAAVLPFAAAMGLFSGLSGRLADRVGPRPQLVAGPLVAGAGFLLLAFTDPVGGYWTAVFPGVLLLAVGMTLAVAPLTATVMSAVDDAHAGTAWGVNNAVARVAGLLAVAVMSLTFTTVFAAAGPPGPSGLTVTPHAAPPALRAAETARFETAYRAVMLLAAACAALAAAPGLLTRPARR